jgi:Uma2 family endonuclease
MSVTTYKWSIKEWHNLVDSGMLEGKKVELLEGEIATMSPEKPIHSSRIVKIADYLRDILRGVAQVREAHPVTLDNFPHSYGASEPEPDIAIVRIDENYYESRHPYPEDIYWLIEISNKTLKIDLEVKSRVYARNGISEYWVIDLTGKKLILHTQPVNNSYSKIMEIVDGKISPESFPDIEIDIERLLSR